MAMSLTFPADFQLVACTNPCPCGRGSPSCGCSEAQRARYRRRLSAPLLDRFDLRLPVNGPEPGDEPGEASAPVRERVADAVERQRYRYADWPWRRNAHVAAGALTRLVPLDDGAAEAWHWLIDDRGLTGRGAARIRRVARTLADLDGAAHVRDTHVLSAALLRDDVP
jgi:magnesium chelatase family protein